MYNLTILIKDSSKPLSFINTELGVAIIGSMTLFFGEYWFLFAGLLICNVCDWLTGNYKAKRKHISSSVEGAAGIMKKVSYWIVIAIAFYVSMTFERMGVMLGLNLSFMEAFGWMTLATYLVNEIRSIIENLVESGVEVPEFLIKGLAVTKKLMDAKNGDSDNTSNNISTDTDTVM